MSNGRKTILPVFKNLPLQLKYKWKLLLIIITTKGNQLTVLNNDRQRKRKEFSNSQSQATYNIGNIAGRLSAVGDCAEIAGEIRDPTQKRVEAMARLHNQWRLHSFHFGATTDRSRERRSQGRWIYNKCIAREPIHGRSSKKKLSPDPGPVLKFMRPKANLFLYLFLMFIQTTQYI